MNKSEFYRKLPSVDILLKEAKLKNIMDDFGREYLKEIISKCLEDLREKIKTSDNLEIEYFNMDNIVNLITEIYRNDSSLFIPVINATGTVLHTNLGRSPISREIYERAGKLITNYCNLEYDINTNQRGSRDVSLKKLICKITGCEDAIVVNNNAAAVFLTVNSLCFNKKVLVSMDQLVEIGGSFRIPDIINSSGANLGLVGTTNKTYIRDFEDNIDENSAMIMKVSKSNFYIEGFTHNPTLEELSKLSQKTNKIFYVDLGSGLIDNSIFNVENTVIEAVKFADIVSFSCDKILGGPQGGIICGKTEYITKIRKNQLYRILRTGKAINALLYETLKTYIQEPEKILINSIFTQSRENLQNKAESILKDLIDSIENSNLVSKNHLIINEKHNLIIENSKALVGGGALPREEIESVAINIKSPKINEIDRYLRQNPRPVSCRVQKDVLSMDMISLSRENCIDITKKLIYIFKIMEGNKDE